MNKLVKKGARQMGKSGARQTHNNILTLKKEMGLAFLNLGKLLKIIRDNEFYEELGYKNFTSYVINSELGFKRSTAYYYIEIFEFFAQKLKWKQEKIAEMGYDKLVRLMPVIKKNPEKTADLVTDAQVLRPYDFNKKYRDEEKQKGHEDVLAPPEYFRCEKCGKWKIVIPIDDCCPEFVKEIYIRAKRKISN